MSAEDPGVPGSAGFMELSLSLQLALKLATDDLPPALAAINAVRHFDGKPQVDAIEFWLLEREAEDAAFDRLRFLNEYCAQSSRDPGPFVVLAESYRAVGDKELSRKAIVHALGLRQWDLYSQRVFLNITAWLSESGDTTDSADDYLKGRFCDQPFENFETGVTGDVFVCCPSYLPVSIGNLHKATAEEIWNSAVAAELRRSISDGSFRYCSRLHCGKITSRKLDPARSPADSSPAASAPLPKRAVLSHDRSCNLACPSCRKDFIVAKKAEQERLNILLDNSIMPILRGAKLVTVTGSGDPFGSNHFRSLLKRINRRDYPELTVDLHTNGQLFDQQSWDALELEGLIGAVEISIDAARPETYSIVRRGGDFGRLKSNLAFIRHLRRTNEISHLKFSFVVQAQNYEEMPEFVELGEEFGADIVVFNMIRNWGTFTSAEFECEFVGSSLHPAYKSFLRILESPQLMRPIVRRSNLTTYVSYGSMIP